MQEKLDKRPQSSATATPRASTDAQSAQNGTPSPPVHSVPATPGPTSASASGSATPRSPTPHAPLTPIAQTAQPQPLTPSPSRAHTPFALTLPHSFTPLPRPEDAYEILCNDAVLPLDMTLAAVRQYVWRQTGELVMYYRRKRLQAPPVPAVP